ncbi:putative ACR, COG1259 [Candidatus Ornithobacterium hominis]|uniref:bifunctional nuclease family protein n=1 Tax=Candidatus Ornithobacterium hominis TaxID=2497989 RepID=UPI0024BD0F27|nr:bifunctional nuclease domain-containing protein [Candidatus Ornithobacterium hominis]CAI9429531.1 putative ACR, COG1259 [Candidatus Ornithobacterium hominis]
MNYIKLNIRGISYSQTQVGAYALILEEEFGGRKLPIIIGNFEAQAIALALEKDLTPPRPLTHDLFMNFCHLLEIEMKNVLIYNLEEGIFYSNIIFEDKDNILHELDSRTSDAIALAVRFNCPIYVKKEVMDRAGIKMEIITEEDSEEIKAAIHEIEKELTNENKSEEEKLLNFTIKELEKQLQQAVETENYELAASIRDELSKREKE